MEKLVTAVFEQGSHAENAARQIKDEGLRTDDISIVAKQGEGGEKTPQAEMRKDEGVRDNISDGVVTGGIIGGLAGLLIGAGTMMIPGLGIVAAAGPITGLLSGTATGGIAGGLIDLGIPEHMGREYEEDIKEGKILFSMKAGEGNAERVVEILKSNGAQKVRLS